MRTVYLDSDFICHLEDATGRIPYQTEMFDGKCDALVEAYRIVPEGSVWTRYDGVQFKGELISPADNYDTARFHQTQFEEDNENMMPLDDVAELVEMVYQDDIGVIG